MDHLYLCRTAPVVDLTTLPCRAVLALVSAGAAQDHGCPAWFRADGRAAWDQAKGPSALLLRVDAGGAAGGAPAPRGLRASAGAPPLPSSAPSHTCCPPRETLMTVQLHPRLSGPRQVVCAGAAWAPATRPARYQGPMPSDDGLHDAGRPHLRLLQLEEAEGRGARDVRRQLRLLQVGLSWGHGLVFGQQLRVLNGRGCPLQEAQPLASGTDAQALVDATATLRHPNTAIVCCGQHWTPQAAAVTCKRHARSARDTVIGALKALSHVLPESLKLERVSASFQQESCPVACALALLVLQGSCLGAGCCVPTPRLHVRGRHMPPRSE